MDFLPSLAGQGPLVYWVALHRMHHQRSDQEGDPHSPQAGASRGWSGFWHSHVGWMLTHPMPNTMRYARDLIVDPRTFRLNTLYPAFFLSGLIVPALGAGLWNGAWLEGLLWGGFVRVFLVQHVIWSINSVCHIAGRRPFGTGDGSTNVAWLAVPSFGESWHNNHHHAPSSAFHGMKWWQIDLAGLTIRTMRALGWISEVRTALEDS